MGNAEFIGIMVLVFIPAMISLVTLIKPIITLNVNIQKLSDAINQLNSDYTGIKKAVEENKDTLNDHETRITILERKDYE